MNSVKGFHIMAWEVRNTLTIDTEFYVPEYVFCLFIFTRILFFVPFEYFSHVETSPALDEVPYISLYG